MDKISLNTAWNSICFPKKCISHARMGSQGASAKNHKNKTYMKEIWRFKYFPRGNCFCLVAKKFSARELFLLNRKNEGKRINPLQSLTAWFPRCTKVCLACKEVVRQLFRPVGTVIVSIQKWVGLAAQWSYHLKRYSALLKISLNNPSKKKPKLIAWHREHAS